nr:cyclin dependent kinase 11B [Hymenolepis microstoma]
MNRRSDKLSLVCDLSDALQLLRLCYFSMSRGDYPKHPKHLDQDKDEEELDYGEIDDDINDQSPREEGEAISEEGEASSDNTNSMDTELQEREYRQRLAQRKVEREAEASQTVQLPPRSKFDSPERSDEIHKPSSTGTLLNPSTSSNSGGESSSDTHSRKRNHECKTDSDKIPPKIPATSRHIGTHHRHHHRSHQSKPDKREGGSDLHDNSLLSFHLLHSPEEKSKTTDTTLVEPSGALNARLPPGRAPVIDGSRFKYLEESEEESDGYGDIEKEVYGGEDGDLLRANGIEIQGQGDEEIPSEHDRPPVKPFYFPSIQGCRSVDEFECLNRIEEGTYGVVYRARDKKTNEVFALKRLKMEKEREGFPITSLREINTLMKAQHENIVTVREVVVGFDLDKIYLVMEYVEHDLKSLMEVMSGPFTVGQVKCLLIQLLRAVQHLHDNWILHRDLKTSNLLLSHKGILKVGDFGLAREYGSPLQHYTEVVVTLWYRAIELLLGSKSYSTAIDMWSVGCIFAEFLLQRPLFPGKGEVDQVNMIFRDLGTPNERIWPGVSQLPGMKNTMFTEYPYNQLRRRFTEKQISASGFELLTSLLTYCPERRLTAEKALTHRYFTERPQAIHPSMMPSWPAKSEGCGRPATAAGSKRPASPKPPPGATGALQEPPPPLGASRFFAISGASKRTPSKFGTSGAGSGARGSGNDMITSSISSLGIPLDLEFSLDEIRAELAKLGVNETSPAQLTAIKADLDKMIAHDLESLSLDERRDCTLGSSSMTTTSSFSPEDSDLTLTIDPSFDEKHGNETQSNEVGHELADVISSLTDFEVKFSQRRCHSANSIVRKRWINPIRNNDDFKGEIVTASSRGSLRTNSAQSKLRSSNNKFNENPSSFSSSPSPLYEINPAMLENNHGGRASHLDRNFPRSGSAPSRRLFPSNQRRGVNRSDPVSLWRMYNSQWERQARTNVTSERALRWSVKAAMAVREVPLLNSSRRSLLYGPFSSHRL